ncbi:GNAT family N-acetyltransferase [Roseivivax isoporae]|uniref:Acetyltransferase n=1 Tax=Roseivivax isoporae LMG 25204 TaxID=1449351 RepID=X7FFU9_9RHOB|nr:GNAT family N-acetyltransferase [Roseivivax isoporae]ETX30936.1 acetyltransferase [Roseivivax isoporae LMG 25204]
MTDDDMAALMARAYRHQAPWTAPDITALRARPTTLVLDAPGGFLIAQVVIDEAEILALATDPAKQRRGVATALLDRFHADCAARGVARTLLDVAEDNGPARALYHRAGYAETARRRGYYARAEGRRADALLMARAVAREPAGTWGQGSGRPGKTG